MRILAYCIMRNHFHFLLWPYAGADLPLFMHYLMTLHIARYLQHYRPSSPGHIYQDRYTNVIVEPGASVLRVARYVEANAFTAGIVERAEEYPWSSASPEAQLIDTYNRPLLAPWPVPKPENWPTLLNLRTASQEMRRIQQSASRGAPYGSPAWTGTVAKQFNLEDTLRPRGRPRRGESVILTGVENSRA